MPTNPNGPNIGVPEVDVLINGSPVSAAVLGYVGEVTVDDSVEWPSMFSFVMFGSDVQDEDLPWVDNGLFSVGNAVEIKMGWAGAGNTTSLIAGEITALEPSFVFAGLPVLKVRGYDRRHRLQRGRKTRTFLEMTDSDIAAQIGGGAGLSVEGKPSGIVLDYVLQANQTDWEFLRERARLIRYEVVVSDKTLFFRPVGNDQTEILSLDFGRGGLFEFHPRLSLLGQATGVKVQSWSVNDKQALQGVSGAGDEVSTMGGQLSGAVIAESAFGDAIDVVTSQPVEAQAEADQLAKARFNDLILDLITGEGACAGNPALRAGKVIKIGGIGQRFGGQYYVTSAIHRISEGDYLTEFTVRRNAT
jgi:Bacteriophage probable baseplate hub protein